MNAKKVIRIGNASGYWGDDPLALKRQIDNGHLDYITMDFLAEITMSILNKQFQRDQNLGYATDFISSLENVLPQLVNKKIKLITNAGGVNPVACAQAVSSLANSLSLSIKIAIIEGDNILHKIGDFYPDRCKFQNMEDHRDFSHIEDQVTAANIYFGATPVVAALQKWNPDIIITGRVTDTGITLAPMIYEFGWNLKDWNKLASGIIAGHLLECGSQVCGGNFTDWQKIESFDNMGYPIAEVNADGSFVITKHESTGGKITVDTVKEQLFYEMSDPKAYITPDVVVDFSSVKLEACGKDKVKVSEVKGYEPSDSYKISMAYKDGYKASGSILICGPDARAKAEKFAEIFWNRCEGHFLEKNTEYIGWNSCHKSLGHKEEANEILLLLGVRSDSQSDVRSFNKLVPSLILSGPPGVTVLGGVPKIQEIMSYWPALINKKLCSASMSLFYHQNKETIAIEDKTQEGSFTCKENEDLLDTATKTTISSKDAIKEYSCSSKSPLSKICFARSGDKGDSVNIGILARNDKAYAFIKKNLTAQLIKNLFQEFCKGKVIRYDLDKLNGLNFILEKSLGGGGSCTLRADSQGKTFSQALLRQRFNIPEDII